MLPENQSFQTGFNSVNRKIQIKGKKALLIDIFEYYVYKSMLAVYDHVDSGKVIKIFIITASQLHKLVLYQYACG